MKQVVVISLNTFKEMIRDRILYSLVFFCFFLLILSYLLGFLSFAEQERIIANLGLMAIQIGSCFLSIFLGSTLVWREIEKQTVLVLLSKPITRFQFLLGKYLGLSLVLLFMNFVFSVVLFLVCHNFSFFNIENYLVAQVGTFLESLLILSFALFFGVFSRPILTVLFTFSLWVIGHFMKDLAFFSMKSKNGAFQLFGGNFSKYFLDLEKLNFRDAVIYPEPLVKMELFYSLIYCFVWLFVMMFFTQKIFKRRDFL